MDESRCFRKVRLSTPALCNRTEKWLKKLAASGWRLEKMSRWNFEFRKCSPYDTEFFFYENFPKEKGLQLTFWNLKKRYGNKKHRINKELSDVFEADMNKVDEVFSNTESNATDIIASTT